MNKSKLDRIDTNFDDKNYRYAFAHQYHLDPDKDLDLMKQIHTITTVRRVYDAKQNTSESVVEYFNDLKDFVTSEQYSNVDEIGKRHFEQHAFEILKSIIIKGIGTEHFITGSVYYLSKPNVDEPLDEFWEQNHMSNHIWDVTTPGGNYGIFK